MQSPSGQYNYEPEGTDPLSSASNGYVDRPIDDSYNSAPRNGSTSGAPNGTTNSDPNSLAGSAVPNTAPSSAKFGHYYNSNNSETGFPFVSAPQSPDTTGNTPLTTPYGSRPSSPLSFGPNQRFKLSSSQRNSHHNLTTMQQLAQQGQQQQQPLSSHQQQQQQRQYKQHMHQQMQQQLHQGRRHSHLNMNHYFKPFTRRGSTFSHNSNQSEGHNHQVAIDSDHLQLPSASLSKLTQRTSRNLRQWYLRRQRNSKRRTELENLREIERSRLLFAQMFAFTPLIMITASGLRPEDADEHKVPAMLQQLSILVTSGQAHHYKNLLRIHLEYGSGLGMVKWEVLRGYRDLLFLRAKLKSRSKLKRGPKLPKLPKPKHFGLIDKRSFKTGKPGPFEEPDDLDFDSDDDLTESEDDEPLDENERRVLEIEASIERDEADLAETAPNHSALVPHETGETSAASVGGGNLSTAASVMTGNGNQTPSANVTPGGTQTPGGSQTPGGHYRINGGTPVSPPGKRASGHSSSGHHHHWRNHRSGENESVTSHAKKSLDNRIRFAKAVESWLNRVKEIYMLRSDSNDLFKFFEMSHLSLKLAPEYQFHGKEGHMFIRSRAIDMGWRVSHFHLHDFQDMVQRHTKKWVLIRDSFIVIVDNIYSTLIREVFLVDSSFDVKHVELPNSLFATITNSGENSQNDLTEQNLEQYNRKGSVGQVDGFEAIEMDVNQAEADIPSTLRKDSNAKSVFLHLENNERELKLATRTDRELRRWQAGILQMQMKTPWSKRNRFDSFAPVRKNVFGQWFVDARDYFWVLSDALENARDTIFILDWWLSPELYLRRPPEGNQKWRLDRILKRKAEQGVKIFVIVYRNVNQAIPIDSLWTKHSLLDLHENIHVMRSPNQLKNKGALFWSHHEKLCVIDSTIAFNGGVDMCFGRWDTWEHTLIDDAPRPFLPSDPTEEEWKNEKTQLFPGKEYNNARVRDFYDLNKPWEESQDRNSLPRMPWHDVHQMVLGQPARDFSRHFVQRWNYVIRQKLPSRRTPFLLPPPDFTAEELERLQLTGTCEYQVLRSSGEWSLGLKKHEQSIQNAYLKLIEESEHFVYIENQFFCTSTEVDGVKLENEIGNALVQRIVRAHENGENWKAFITIPLMPGYEGEIDSDKSSSVRIICQCQYNSISRGPRSIFYRLEQMGIRPDQYINFMSLRKWGKFGENNEGRLTTELLYIHAKTMIVDDRAAIIGSANINERSMRGFRDSEVAVCVRDTNVVNTTMGGKPYKVGKFAHTLRMRLMREHLGVDIDKFDIVERFMTALDVTAKQVKSQASGRTPTSPMSPPRPHQSERTRIEPEQDPAAMAALKDVLGSAPVMDEFPTWLYPELHSFNWYAGTNVNKGIRDHKSLSHDSRLYENAEHYQDVYGDGYDHWEKRLEQEQQVQLRQMQAAKPHIEMEQEARSIMHDLLRDRSITSKDHFKRVFYARLAKQDILRPVKRAADLPHPHVDEDGMRAVNCETIPVDPWNFSDPLDDKFVQDIFLAIAERNTIIFRMVFRCQPDDEVETWKDYKTYAAHMERFYEKQREDGGPDKLRKTGQHHPERVNKLVLSGAIKKADPSVIHNQIKNASKHERSEVSTAAASLLSEPKTKKKGGALADIEPVEEDFDRQEYAGLSTEERVEREMERLGLNNNKLSESPMHKTNSLPYLNKIPNSPRSGQAESNVTPVATSTTDNQSGEGGGTLNVPESHVPGTSAEASIDQGQGQGQEQVDMDTSGFQPARKWGHFDHVLDAQVAEDILQGITGHLVVFPTEWLNRELDSGNWSFQLDRMAPLEIYD